MNTTVAAQMTGADFLKLRRKRGTLIWALVLALGPILIYFTVAAIQHASNPVKYGPAGGVHNFGDGLRVIALFFGPLAAILIGVEAGAGDASAGVFRDLVVTGRSRLALFASRVPAALAICWIVMLSGYALLVLGIFVFAGNLATPDFALLLNGLAFTFLGTGVLCVVAVGLASLTTSKAGAIIALIAWQIVASPLITHISSLGSARNAVLTQAIAHFSPVSVDGAHVTMSGATAVVVLLGWLVAFLGLGAWRTRTMDA
ncbi:MAG TPA: ABC transporter permease [Solirubrobacteraceae bacterium]|jgi:ABC-type transport system involved in multi-copper enzyme maturation permease subunit